MRTAHAQIVTRVNASQIKHETIDGEDHIRIPSATLPAGIVMNGLLYPGDEIEAGYKALEGAPAPLGHPMQGNEFVSAKLPRSMNKYGVGAWNENVRLENGRVLLDKVINVRVANQTEGGRQLLKAIEQQAPISTSTGLHIDIQTANGESRGKPYTGVARNMRFDHDAILLNETPAANTSEGVGIFVNSAGEREDVMVCNLDLTDDEQMTIESMAEHIIDIADRADRREQNRGLVNRLVDAIKSAIGGAQSSTESSHVVTANQSEAPEGDMTKEEMQELLKPVTDQLTAVNTELASIKEAQTKQGETVQKLQANAEAAEAAKTAEIDAQLVQMGYSEDDVKGMTANAKQVTLKMAGQQTAGYGHNLHTQMTGNAAAETYDMPE